MDAYFSPLEADFAVRFFESLVLTKSTRSGQPENMRLLPQNRKLVVNLFGWRRPDGRRLIRIAFPVYSAPSAPALRFPPTAYRRSARTGRHR